MQLKIVFLAFNARAHSAARRSATYTWTWEIANDQARLKLIIREVNSNLWLMQHEIAHPVVEYDY